MKTYTNLYKKLVITQHLNVFAKSLRFCYHKISENMVAATTNLLFKYMKSVLPPLGYLFPEVFAWPPKPWRRRLENVGQKTIAELLQKLLLFFIIIFIFHDIQAEEKLTEKFIKEEVVEEEIFNRSEETFRGVKTRGINNNDLSNFYALLAKQTVHQITGGDSTKTLSSVSNKIDEIHTSIIHNLSIIAQLGLINTSAASSPLTTTLVVINANVDTYNNDITAALVAVSVAVITPSKNNTITAQALLSTAINNFNDIVSDYYGNKSVSSMYSFAEINSSLAQLNAQLAYLSILQGT